MTVNGNPDLRQDRRRFFLKGESEVTGQLKEKIEKLGLHAERHRRAAQEGDAASQFCLGTCYLAGAGGVAADRKEAAKWLQKAAEHGHVQAQFTIGCLYGDGDGVEQDTEEAMKWFGMAAEQGDADAQYYLGLCHFWGSFPVKSGIPDIFKGIKGDMGEAVNWFRKSAGQGNIIAATTLGTLYQYGYGVKKDEDRAQEYFRKMIEPVRRAAEGGDADSQCMLGLFYENGFGVEKNEEEAIRWYQRSSGQDSREAANALMKYVLLSMQEMFGK